MILIHGFCKKTHCSVLHRSGADPILGNGRDEDERHPVAVGPKPGLKLDPAGSRHPHIGDHAPGLRQLHRLLKSLRRGKCMNDVSEGAHKIADGGADRIIVVNDRDHRNFNQIDQSWILSEARYFGLTLRHDVPRSTHTNVSVYEFERSIPSVPAILTKSATDRASIFFIMCPRWIFTVISLTFSFAAICLFISPDVTKENNSLCRGVSPL